MAIAVAINLEPMTFHFMVTAKSLVFLVWKGFKIYLFSVHGIFYPCQLWRHQATVSPKSFLTTSYL